MRISDWSSDVCSSDLTKSGYVMADMGGLDDPYHLNVGLRIVNTSLTVDQNQPASADPSYWGTDSWNGVLRDFTTDRVVRRYTDFLPSVNAVLDRKSTRLNSSH